MIERPGIGHRLDSLRDELVHAEIDALLVSDVLNVRWLTGFTGSLAYAFVSGTEAWIGVDSRYTVQASGECPGWSVERLASSSAENLAELLKGQGIRRLGAEADQLTYAAFCSMRDRLDGAVELVPTNGIIGRLRMIKDDVELNAIRAACRAVDTVATHLMDYLRSGISERDVMLELESTLRNGLGLEIAFPSIVVSGPRTALPHGQPTDRLLQPGDFVTMDYGAKKDGYCSDITRTIVLGAADSEQARVHSVVLEAQRRAIAGIRDGVAASAVDALAREHIAANGYGDYFGHGLGHSLGLHVHDGGGMAPSSNLTLQAGMVLTVEPGIYVPGWGGVRIEDDIVVTADGCEALTSANRELVEII